jgi:hypothetical protein
MAEFALIQQAGRTTTGTQDYTSSGFGTPIGAIFMVTPATVNGTQVDDAILSVGFTDGTRNVSQCSSEDDAADPTDCNNIGNTTACISLTNQAGTIVAKAAFSAWITDGIRINWSVQSTSVAYLVTCTLIGGTVSNVYCNKASVSDTNGVSTDITAPNFEPTFLFVLGGPFAAGLFNDTSSTPATTVFSLVTNNGAGSVTQRSITKFGNDASASTSGGTYFGTTYAVEGLLGTHPQCEIASFDSQGFSTIRRGNSSSTKEIGYLAVKLPAGMTAKIVDFDTPIGTGSYSVTGAGILPQFAMVFTTGQTAAGLDQTANSEVLGMGVVTSAAQYSASIYADTQSAAAANTSSVVDSKPIRIRRNNSDYMVETFTAFTSDGMTLNATTVQPTTGRKRTFLFVKSAARELDVDPGAYTSSGQEVLFRILSPLYLRYRK